MMEKLIFSSVLGPRFNQEFPQEEISCGTLSVNCIALKTKAAASSRPMNTSDTSLPPSCCYAAMAFSTLWGSRERAATIAGTYFSPERTP